MKPYKRTDKSFMVELRKASALGKVVVLIKEFAVDVRALWRYGAAFPTFLKLTGTILLCLIVLMPLLYPLFILLVTYFSCKAIILSLWLDEPWRLYPGTIFRDAVSSTFRPCIVEDLWKVREVLTRALLLAHSLATSVDYLCVMQGLLDEN